MKRMDGFSHFNTGYQTSARASCGEAAMIGQLVKNLAAAYRELLEEPLPERLSSLLRLVDDRARRADNA